MSDLIDRGKAIDIVRNIIVKEVTTAYMLIDKAEVMTELMMMPQAQPERKRGFWWAIEKGEKGYSAGNFRCSVCGEPNVSYIPKPNFCPNCGSDMRGEQDDK
jgi:rubrerythrin